MIVTIRINKSESDLESILSAISKQQRAQLFKTVYRQYLKEKEVENLKNSIDITHFVETKEEIFKSNCQILMDSMNKFGVLFNKKVGGNFQ